VEAEVASVVTINRPDVVALMEETAERLTGGNKTEAVALALRRLKESTVRSGTLFGVHKGSAIVRDDVDLTEPVLQDAMDAGTGPMP
jgi:hypothetical protein